MQTSFVPFEPLVRALLTEHPEMPATVTAEWVGWEGSIWFSGQRAPVAPRAPQA